jgi:3-isopropylmalate/(R)-2-methylmalate dehydratase small subunit
MQSFHRLAGIATPFLRANVDTDVIMPKQFLKGVDREGLAAGVFFDPRFNEAKRQTG